MLGPTADGVSIVRFSQACSHRRSKLGATLPSQCFLGVGARMRILSSRWTPRMRSRAAQARTTPIHRRTTRPVQASFVSILDERNGGSGPAPVPGASRILVRATIPSRSPESKDGAPRTSSPKVLPEGYLSMSQSNLLSFIGGAAAVGTILAMTGVPQGSQSSSAPHKQH